MKNTLFLKDHISVYSVVSDQIYQRDSSWTSCVKCTHRSSGESNKTDKQKAKEREGTLQPGGGAALFKDTHIFSILFVLATILFLGCHMHQPKMVKPFSIGFPTLCPAGRAYLWVGKEPREKSSRCHLKPVYESNSFTFRAIRLLNYQWNFKKGKRKKDSSL